jgi:hypothetical protein
VSSGCVARLGFDTRSSLAACLGLADQLNVAAGLTRTRTARLELAVRSRLAAPLGFDYTEPLPVVFEDLTFGVVLDLLLSFCAG